MADGLSYDPNIAMHRRVLAQHVLNVVLTAGFVEEDPTSRNASIKERVFYRVVDGSPDVRIQVWTTIVNFDGDATVRDSGQDAIRVCAVYSTKGGLERGIVSATRIHRVGTIEAICDRLLTRMREVYRKAARPQRCDRCGAPTFKSKNGNQVCAEICFKNRR
jgi:hypothetical protein